jgi:hypothetical protein
LLQKVDYWKYFLSQVLNEHLRFLRKGFYIRRLSIRNEVHSTVCRGIHIHIFTPTLLNWTCNNHSLNGLNPCRLGRLSSEVPSLFLCQSKVTMR